MRRRAGHSNSAAPQFSVVAILAQRARAAARMGYVSTCLQSIQIAIVVVALGILWLTVNWVYQVARKPSELFFPVSGTLNKAPGQTWRQYELVFRRYSTNAIGPDLLAAIAQVEGSGNPIPRTYWKWSWSLHPLQIYRPASSAVGMFQITDSTFADARHFCIRNHSVIEDGPWNDWHSCWFNGLYSRIIPAHSAELTAAYLDHHVNAILARRRVYDASPQQKEELAAMIHLCGAGAADNFARNGFRFRADERCGDQGIRAYVAQIRAMMLVFERLAVLQDDQW